MSDQRKDKIVFAGHSHVDLAWLWTKDETIHLVVEGMINYTLRLMDEFPFTKFSQSSAQIYSWVEQYYPELFSKIKEKVRSGAWEVVGGSWSEFSPNLTPEEALVRQYLYGKLYFKERFSKDPDIAWLPDSFGFPWSMPQILEKSGIKYFMTNKLNWQIQRMKKPIPFPYYVFTWRGPDGSKVLGHLTPGPYNGPVRQQLALDLLSLLKKKHGVNELLYLYGYGDHGGGFVKYMIKDALDFAKYNDSIEVKFGTAGEFFSDLARYQNIPLYDDELYLKTHRGTFTTESRIKKALRDLDEELTLAEKLSTISAFVYGREYPKGDLRKAWEALLYMTTHDIADGTSLKAVYDEIFSEDYPFIRGISQRVINESLSSMLAPGKGAAGKGDTVTVINPLSWRSSQLVAVPLADKSGLQVVDPQGKKVLSQMVLEGEKAELLVMASDLPALGYKSFKLEPVYEKSLTEESGVVAGQWFLENELLRVELDPDTGLLSSVYDKKNRREVLDASRRGNVLQLYEDIPPNAPSGEPAWNLYLAYKNELTQKASMEIVSSGPLVASIRVTREYGHSKFVQEVALRATSDTVEFALKADWNEKYSTLKVSFPLAYTADFATYGVQFGSVQRFRFDLNEPKAKLNYPDRSWEEADTAKFEVPGHRWVNVDELGGRYGTALFVRDKFAFSHEANEIKITLLRGPRREDRLTDRWVDQSSEIGEHVIRYALHPHARDWQKSEIPNLAYEETVKPLVWIAGPDAPLGEMSFLEVKPSRLIVTALKVSEEGQDPIIRLYNPYGEKIQGEALVHFDAKVAEEVDLMESGDYIKRELSVAGGTVKFEVGPFEIKTIRLSKST